MNKRLPIITCLILINIFLYGQSTSNVQMADTMRSDGKIFVVVAVILAIFAGIIFYLIRLDRKISHLEKNNKNL